jgi:hypothetical protein
VRVPEAAATNLLPFAFLIADAVRTLFVVEREPVLIVAVLYLGGPKNPNGR